jgi:TolB protein
MIRKVLLLGLLLAAGPLRAQDTTRAIDRGVRVGITYAPGVRPSIVVMPSRGLDSARAILARDLDYSDRFEVVSVPPADSAPVGLPLVSDGDPRAGSKPGSPNYGLLRAFGADYGVELSSASPTTAVRLHDLSAGKVREQQTFTLPPVNAPDFRMAVHRIADEVVRWITGTPGIAATQILFVSDKRIYRIDSDGNGSVPLTGETEEALSPAWSPDRSKLVYTQFAAGRGSLVVLTLATHARATIPGTTTDLNITPVFSPDGKTLAFARASGDGTDIYTFNLADWCCLHRLTVGQFADNLSPTYSSDGRRIAFVSTRASLPQIYVMDADGADQELFAPFDYGVTGSSNAPEWSPDGATVVFHREVSQVPQLFLLQVAGQRVRQLTSTGRNTDATWAPDGRHLAFVSDRSGRRQLWVIDSESGRIRQLTFIGAARLPAWSRRLTASAGQHP